MDINNQIKKLGKEYADNPTFENLEKLSEIMVTAQDEKKASEGFRNLLTQLYPDNAHYIYELLQNAQDANKDNDKPATVKFTLTEEQLEFEHNGKKLFDIKDVESITGLAETTKIDDKTNIGKFGVGFKSVFAITDEPEIISGKYHFTIEKLFIPRPKPDLSEKESIISRFIFPFNNPKKPREQAFKEIENELHNLGSETLLFLNNINKIEYLLPDGKTLGYMEQIEEEEDGIATIKVKIPNEDEKIYYWLRYIDKIIIVDENGKEVVWPIAIAFKLEKNEQKESKSKWRIMPPVNKQGIEKGEVCIFFPATNENSKLFFHIHAPFASTVARNCIRPCEENNKLRDSIAELIAKSLIDIKKRGLLSMDFLGILPNADDELIPFYEPIRKNIVSTFKENPLVPTKNGSFASAIELFRCPSSKQGGLRISEVIDDDDLSLLIGQKPPLWVKNANLKNQRDDKFLVSLEIKEWGKNELESHFNPKTNEEKHKIETWINSKSDEWLMKLYALLYNEEIKIDTTLKIIHLTTNNFISASEVVYFLPENDDNIPSNLYFVKRDVYNTGDAEKRKKDAHSFLEEIGVKQYTEDEKTRLHLKELADKYTIFNPDVSEKQYIEDVKEFCSYKSSKELLEGKYFVLDKNNNFCKADTVCTPLISKLIEYAEISSEYKKVCINKIYKEKLNEEQYDKFVKFIKELGAMYKLKVIPEENYFSKDYKIEGIEKIILKLDLEQYRLQFAKLIWDAVQECQEWGARFKYSEPDNRYTSGYRNDNEPSTIVKILTSSAWIPDKDGNLYKPQDISADMLPNDFEIINNSYQYLFKALRFGENLVAKQTELHKRKEAAKTLGISLDFLDLLNKSRNIGIDVENILRENLNQEKIMDETDDFFDPGEKNEEKPFTKEPISSLNFIREFIKQEYKNAPKVERQKRLREIRISYNRNKVRTHIRERYHRYCQLCQKQSPFWEITEIFLEPLKELDQMNLSLCPDCASEYRIIRNNENKMKVFKENLRNNVNPEKDNIVQIEEKYVWFTNKHLAEIQEILKLELEAETPLNFPQIQPL